MDKQTLLMAVAVTFVCIVFGGIAATVLIIALIAAGFVLAFLLRAIVGAKIPAGLSHEKDELALFFLYTAMTQNRQGTPAADAAGWL